MIAAPEVPAADRSAAAFDRASAGPAALAAIAEAGVLFLPVQEIAREVTLARTGPMVAWTAFVPLYVGAVVLATIWRRSRWSTIGLIAGAVGVAATQTLIWGHADPLAVAGMSIVALLVALRAATLAARDWRDPIGGSLGITALGLLLEVAVAGDATQPWPRLIGPVIVVFFVGALASRVASVRIEEAGRSRAPVPAELRIPGAPLRLAVPAMAAIGAGLALVAFGGGHTGPLHWAGVAVLLALAGILLAAAWVLSPIVILVSWLGERLHLDLFAWLHGRLRRLPLLSGIDRNVHGHVSVIQQMLEVASMLAVIGLLILLIRKRRRLRIGPIARRPAPDVLPTSFRADPMEAVRRRFGIRRELPEVTVRRLYAEALLALERRDLSKPGHLTPAEFAPWVVAAFPAVRSSFDDLTHAYEDVRYGEREITHARVARLRERRSLMLETIRSGDRADVAPVADSPSAVAPDGSPSPADGWIPS